jgi:hypothetical protein
MSQCVYTVLLNATTHYLSNDLSADSSTGSDARLYVLQLFVLQLLAVRRCSNSPSLFFTAVEQVCKEFNLPLQETVHSVNNPDNAEQSYIVHRRWCDINYSLRKRIK